MIASKRVVTVYDTSHPGNIRHFADEKNACIKEAITWYRSLYKKQFKGFIRLLLLTHRSQGCIEQVVHIDEIHFIMQSKPGQLV